MRLPSNIRGIAWLVALLALVVVHTTFAQQAPGAETVLLVPFENNSKAPGLEWIGESFPEILSQRLVSPGIYVIGREDRTYAFDRTGIPGSAKPSRATVYAVAEQMDADYVVLGSYDFDGNVFSARAQLLDMKRLHLLPEVQSSGPLTALIDVQTALAWELLQQFPNKPSTSREQFMKTSKPVRLDAFESYLRGTLAADRQQKIKYFRDATRLNPNYTLAMLQLGKEYYKAHEYESSSAWFSRVPKNEPEAGEANFLLGMSEYYRGNYEKSFAAFNFLVTRLPLTEVYNNLGVVEERRDHRASATEYFAKAVNADPTDADYRFNLAVALFKSGDTASAAHNLREALQHKPNDGEARALLEMINRGVTVPSSPASNSETVSAVVPGSQPRIPLERIKRNYDEASYRQLAMEIHNLTEQRLVNTDRKSHAAYHAEHGQQLLAQNALPEAENEFREAISTDYDNASAHAGMAEVLEQKGDSFNARAEAQASVRLQPNVEAYLVLARLNLKQGQVGPADDAVGQALKLEPANASAQALKSEITAKQVAAH